MFGGGDYMMFICANRGGMVGRGVVGYGMGVL